ncbi:hypothetical protein ACIHFE_02715 [Streptomyces sp. NPDC052396]|uniref:hypothetical protein n=1 Tax=Streptomyces sp. NPDC052396 TaxID=3365689 RepID=UPI0037D27BE4
MASPQGAEALAAKPNVSRVALPRLTAAHGPAAERRDQGRRVFVVRENGTVVERPPGAAPAAERLRARVAEENAASRKRAGGLL